MRNLEEQVKKNKEDIARHYEIDRVLSNFGIKVIGVILSTDSLPDPTDYSGDYGDAYAVGESEPYDFYIFTRPDPNAGQYSNYWLNVGALTIVGPQGPVGATGATGPAGQASLWYFGNSVPVDSNIYNNGDMYLVTGNGTNASDVYRFSVSGSNRIWTRIGNIRGTQGIQGIQGPAGNDGAAGPQGPVGPQGPQGQMITIVGELTSTEQLPTPTMEIRANSYLIPINGVNHVFLITGETEEELQWVDAGSFGEGGTQVSVNGVVVENFNADTKLDKSTTATTNKQAYIKNADGTQTLIDVVFGASTGSSIAQRNPNGTLNVAFPNDESNAATKGYVDTVAANKIDKPFITPTQLLIPIAQTDGTIIWSTIFQYNGTGNPSQNMLVMTGANGEVPTRLTPENDYEATSKKYVDDALANAGGGFKVLRAESRNVITQEIQDALKSESQGWDIIIEVVPQGKYSYYYFKQIGTNGSSHWFASFPLEDSTPQDSAFRETWQFKVSETSTSISDWMPILNFPWIDYYTSLSDIGNGAKTISQRFSSTTPATNPITLPSPYLKNAKEYLFFLTYNNETYSMPISYIATNQYYSVTGVDTTDNKAITFIFKMTSYNKYTITVYKDNEDITSTALPLITVINFIVKTK